MVKKVLCVDDVPVIRELARLALESRGGFLVASCGSGEEALAKVPSFAPDILLLDVMMPGMDGPATLEALRKLPETAATPAVFMTGDAGAEEVLHYRQLGAIGTIAKPFDPLTLADRLEDILQSQPVAGQSLGSGLPAEVVAEFVELQRGYLQGLPEKMVRLQQALASDGLDRLPESLREADLIAHSLAGSAGTFGFPAIGEGAKKLHRTLLPCQEGGLGLDAETLRTARQQCESIAAEVLRARQAVGLQRV